MRRPRCWPLAPWRAASTCTWSGWTPASACSPRWWWRPGPGPCCVRPAACCSTRKWARPSWRRFATPCARRRYPCEIHDLHVWRVGKGSYACILSVATSAPVTPEYFRTLLQAHAEIVHVTVEVNPSVVASYLDCDIVGLRDAVHGSSPAAQEQEGDSHGSAQLSGTVHLARTALQ